MENTLTIPGKMTKTSHLNLVSGEKNCKIPACTGGSKASLRYAHKTFQEGIDVRFEEYKLDTVQPATAEIEAEVGKWAKETGTL